MTEKQIRILSIVATAMSIIMYVSYVFQIKKNLEGNHGDWVQPLAAAINCTLLVIYGLFKKERDWALSIANMPGIILGLTACITSLL